MESIDGIAELHMSGARAVFVPAKGARIDEATVAAAFEERGMKLESYREVLRDLPAGLRIGYSPDLAYAVVQSDVGEVAYDAARVFAELGHHFEEIDDGPPELGRDWGLVGAFELLARIGHLLPEREGDFGRAFIHGVKAGEKMTPAVCFSTAVRRQRILR